MIELNVNPKAIAIATATFYPDWHPAHTAQSVSNVRGELAIQFVQEVVSAGYQIVVVDGGSSDQFKFHLAEIGVSVQPEQEHGMSASRRQSFREASHLSGVKVICWSEPEKVSFIRDCMPQVAVPILNGSADIVVPARDEVALTTYPDYQMAFEMRANRLWNRILHARNLLPPDMDLDICFGPKLFMNDPGTIELFMRRFRSPNLTRPLDRILDPELWHAAVTLPIITALHEGSRVASIKIPYSHPIEQTKIENDTDNDTLRRKRDLQHKNLIVLTTQYIRLLQDGSSRNRLVRVSEG